MEQMTKTVLLIAENLEVRQRLVDFFNQYQYITYITGNMQEAQNLFFSKNHQIDIVIWASMAEKSEVKELLKDIRDYSDIPMIILVDTLSEELHLEYMEAGADHCMKTPFNMKILKAYVDNLYCRRRMYRKKEEMHGNLRIDRGARKAYIDDEDLCLTPKEYAVLDYLIQNTNVVLTREAILDAVWGYDYDGDIRTVDTLIKQLRKKMTTECPYIQSVYGIGYRFEAR